MIMDGHGNERFNDSRISTVENLTILLQTGLLTLFRPIQIDRSFSVDSHFDRLPSALNLRAQNEILF